MKRTAPTLLIIALLVSACGPGSETLRAILDTARSNAGVGAAIDSPYLDLQAWVESVAACSRANGGNNPATTFNGETSAETLFITRTSALVDDEAAAQDIADNLPGKTLAGLVKAKWDRKGLATYRCPEDGLLYSTGVSSDFVAAPNGRYIDEVFMEDDITVHDGLRYGTAPLCEPTGNDLLMDIYEPTGDTLTERPAMVVIHGGGFKNGNRKSFAATAMQYAQRGFVAVSIEYRTCPSGFADEAQYIATATNAIDDGMEAIRFLHANAAAFGIDTTRIAAAGSSAGAAIAYGAALLEDSTPVGPLAAYPSQPVAVMGTGAHLTPALESPGFLTDVPPIMMFRYEFDVNAGPEDPAYGWLYSYRTCIQVHNNGGTCDFFRLPGSGHTSGINPTGNYGDWYMPWFYQQMDLANAN